MKKFLISLVALNLMQPQIFASQSDKIFRGNRCRGERAKR